jgi:hypothetical protein
MSEPKMPELVRELVTFINRLPPSPAWKRLRIAMTYQEIQSYKEFIKAGGNSDNFVMAIRGVPIEIEPHPTDPAFYMERL